MGDYSKCLMYKLRHKDDLLDENIYVGHTIKWNERKTKHKQNCNHSNCKDHNHKKYVEIRANGGWDEWEMLWIEDYPCNNKKEATIREEYLRVYLNAKLNTYKAFSTEEEKIEYLKNWRDTNREEMNIKQKNRDDIREKTEERKQYKQNYRDTHKEESKEYAKNYSENNKEKLAETKKNYRDTHKEECNEYHKNYRKEHKEEISEYHKQLYLKQNTPTLCECGATICLHGLKKHRKTKKHLDIMNEINK
jgi:hypothetical protein